jgi:hypothetical protein
MKELTSNETQDAIFVSHSFFLFRGSVSTLERCGATKTVNTTKASPSSLVNLPQRRVNFFTKWCLSRWVPNLHKVRTRLHNSIGGSQQHLKPCTTLNNLSRCSLHTGLHYEDLGLQVPQWNQKKIQIPLAKR